MSRKNPDRSKALALPDFTFDDDGLVVVRDPASGVAVALMGDDRGPGERAQHGEVRAVGTYVGGKAARASRTIDLMGTMMRNRTIGLKTAKAGRRFASVFHRAKYPDTRAMPLVWQPGGAPGELTERALDARHEVFHIMEMLGGISAPGGSAAWFVLGLGHSIEAWARGQCFGGGRAPDRKAARGIVIGALGVIEAAYDRGIPPRKSDPDEVPLDSGAR